MTTPPPLPVAARSRQRVINIAAMDGWGILVVAGGAGLVSLVFFEWTGVIVCTLACIAGWLELKGRKQLLAEDEGGYSFLRLSQLWLLTVIVGYAAWMLWRGVPEGIIEQVTGHPQMADVLAMSAIGESELRAVVRLTFHLTYGALIVVSCLYQGGMWLFFSRAQRKNREV